MSYFEGAIELYTQRKDEIKKFIDQNKELERQDFLSLEDKRNFMRIIRSNVVLMLYNLIESIFLELFTEFYSLLKDSSLTIDEINPKFFYNLLLLIRRMSQKNINIIKSQCLESKVSTELRLSNLIFKAGFELTKEEKKFLVNGNLDGKKIKEFMISWGIDIQELESLDVSSLQTLKDQRQLLAHGGNSFSEQGRSVTWGNIEDYVIDIEALFIATKKLLIEFFETQSYKLT